MLEKGTRVRILIRHGTTKDKPDTGTVVSGPRKDGSGVNRMYLVRRDGNKGPSMYTESDLERL